MLIDKGKTVSTSFDFTNLIAVVVGIVAFLATKKYGPTLVSKAKAALPSGE